MRPRAHLIHWLGAGVALLWAFSSGAQDATVVDAWDQDAVAAKALELDAIVATASFEPVATDEATSDVDREDAARAAEYAEQLAADVRELAARLAAGYDREETRALVTRIQNRRALLAEMGSAVPPVLSPEDKAAASRLWRELHAYYRGRGAKLAVEAAE